MDGLEVSIKQAYCSIGLHDAYLSQCLLGYDFKCRDCGRVRYRDTDPPEWAFYDSRRGGDVELDRDAILAEAEGDALL